MGRAAGSTSLPTDKAMAETADDRAVKLTAPRGMVRDSNAGGHGSAVAAPHNGADGTVAEVPMTIGEVAREFGVTSRALRFYESKRLVAPLRHGAKRLYRRSDLERLVFILSGRRLGFTLAEISDLVGRTTGGGLHLTREQCVEQINLLERQKRSLEMAIAELRKIYTSYYTALVEKSRS